MIGVAITADRHLSVKDFNMKRNEVRKFLDGFIEVVRPQGLPRPLCLLVDDEGALKSGNDLNIIASALYRGPIFGNAIIVKEVTLMNGERDLAGLYQDEAVDILESLRRAMKVNFIPEGD